MIDRQSSERTFFFFSDTGITGTLSSTLAPLTLSASGLLELTASLNKTLAPLSVEAEGVSGGFGTLTRTLEALTVVAVGELSGEVDSPSGGRRWPVVLPIKPKETEEKPPESRGYLYQRLQPLTVSAYGYVRQYRSLGTHYATLGDLKVQASGELRDPDPDDEVLMLAAAMIVMLDEEQGQL